MFILYTGWWFQALWKIWLRQLGWLFHSQVNGKSCHPFHGSSHHQPAKKYAHAISRLLVRWPWSIPDQSPSDLSIARLKLSLVLPIHGTLRATLEPLGKAPERRAPRAAVRRELRLRHLRQGKAGRGTPQVIRDEDLETYGDAAGLHADYL